MVDVIKSLVTLLVENRFPLLATGVTIIIYTILRHFINRLIRNQAAKSSLSEGRVTYTLKLSNVMLATIVITVLGAIWEISLQGLSIYFASLLTIMGVALFATWSVLSNLTASIFLFFFFPYRIGQRVQIVDSDNTLEGKILDINLFYIKIETEEGYVVAYPNNLAIQKPILIK